MARGQFGYSGVYNSSQVTLSNGEGSAMALDVNGNVIVTPASGASFGNSTADGATFTQGTTTGGLAMGVYVSSPQTLTTGKAGAIAVDVNRNTMVTLATLIAGENLTTNRLNNEPIYSYSSIAADTLVKTGAGTLHTLTFAPNDSAPTAGSIIVYDNTAESGTQIFNWSGVTTTWFVPFTLTLDISFATGLYVGFTTTADVNVTVAYR